MTDPNSPERTSRGPQPPKGQKIHKPLEKIISRLRHRDEDKKVVFILSGGANRGACQVGMLRALYDFNIRPDLILGASAGALNGVSFASNPTLEGIDHLEEVWRSMRRETILPPPRFGSTWRYAKKSPSVYQNDNLRHVIQESISIGYAIAAKMIEGGRDVVAVGFTRYDTRIDREVDEKFSESLHDLAERYGVNFRYFEIDLAQTSSPDALFAELSQREIFITDLILSHCESVDSDILNTTIESFDRHYAVNVRASWLLIRRVVLSRNDELGNVVITSLTSDHTSFNLPYGSTKGALDRVVLAAADEFAHIGLRANVLNPGPVDTGWITDNALREKIMESTPLGRIGLPRDVANIVAFLHSDEGGWINRQLIYSNGGFHNFN